MMCWGWSINISVNILFDIYVLIDDIKPIKICMLKLVDIIQGLSKRILYRLLGILRQRVLQILVLRILHRQLLGVQLVSQLLG